MTDLERPVSSSGAVERFGASIHLADEMVGNFEDRGRRAARLVFATFSESPFQIELNGGTLKHVVSNTHTAAADSGEGFVTDTVDEAASAIHEFMAAEIAGTKPLKLGKYRTEYRSMGETLFPKRRDPQGYKDAFEQALVEGCSAKDLDIASEQQARLILKKSTTIYSRVKA